MSYRLLGMTLKNEHIALGVLLTAAGIGVGASRKETKKPTAAPEKASSIVDSVKTTFGSEDEEKL
ncbi:uncharacterized protein EI90DRAFT_2022739 [Cantharellus anzutake]|uniref:uncharacterized protein n=1 Tax=Cantharellus anzutake TaxID=1750568 RepID=UPI00190458F5|nr:uncharacterized protein EI90DRAFT_2022739 [Cantharellus anzutake]KAF8325848.1 hypothetical protein EI90DRAFT_2022739 [Cantharellus anzutake]